MLPAYAGESIDSVLRYLVPKPFDTRVLYNVAPAVARAVMDSGVARIQLDLDEYRERLRASLSPGRGSDAVDDRAGSTTLRPDPGRGRGRPG